MLLSKFEQFLYRPGALLAVALIIGILLSYRGSPLIGYKWLSLLFVFIAGFMFLLNFDTICNKKILLPIWVLVPAFILLGFFRGNEVQRLTLNLLPEKSSEACVTGYIDYISVKNDGYSITLVPTEVFVGQEYINSQKLLISCDLSEGEGLQPGDNITVYGKIYAFESASNPGQFDSKTYYSIRYIDGGMNASSIKFNHHYSFSLNLKSVFSFIKKYLYKIRIYLSTNIYRTLPENEAGILNSMLTGDRGLLDSEIREAFSEGGIAHILSISSLHISMLGYGLFSIVLKISKRLKFSVFLSMFVMALYLVLTGGAISTTRAVLMFSLMLMARLLGRGYDMLNCAGITAIVLLLKQPEYIYDTGFRLSFAAVIGIFAGSEIIRCYEIKKRMVKSLIISFFLQLVMLPVILSTYYSFHPYSLLINLLIIPLMSILLAAGFVIAISGIALFAFPTYGILKFYEALCEFETKLPYSSILTGAPDRRLVLSYYVFLFIVFEVICAGQRRLCENNKKTGLGQVNQASEMNRNNTIIVHDEPDVNVFNVHKKSSNIMQCRKWIILLLRSSLLMLCLIIFYRPAHKGLTIDVLDVGQGDTNVLRVDERIVLIDSGSTSVKNVGKYRVIPYLKYNAISSIDAVLISHPDYDHVSAIKEMLEAGYPEIKLMVIGINVSMDDEIVQLALSKGVEVKRAGAGDKVKLTKDSEIKVIAPEPGYFYSDSNSASLVLKLEYAGFNALFTGDTDFESENLYSQRLSKASYSLLKCAHHGSKYSTGDELVALITPVITTISCSKYNNYGHPSDRVLQKLKEYSSEVFITPNTGMISIFYNLERIEVKTFKDK